MMLSFYVIDMAEELDLHSLSQNPADWEVPILLPYHVAFLSPNYMIM